MLIAFSLFLVLACCLSAHAQTGYNFVPVTSCRVLDTRRAQGPFGGPAIAAQTTRSFTIPASSCKIPKTATAYALNVTVVPHGVLGYLTVWPTGQTQPVVSTLNSVDGRVKANAAVIAAGTAGMISIFATHTTDVVLDISGYFVLNTDSSALFFFPVTPCRMVDTRNPTGPLGGPSMMAGIGRSFPVLSSGCNISGSARAYSLNLTVVPKGPLGYLTVWPSDAVQPVVSTLNAPTGAVTANAAIVPAAANGSISAYVTNDSDLIIDVNGYFGPESSGNNPLSLFTVTPCRVLDTRSTSILNGTLSINVAGGPCGIPSAANAYVMNATVVPSGPLGYLTLWPHGATRPLVSTLNATDGFITSNMAVVPGSSGWIDAYSTNPTHLILDTTGYFADIATLQILTSTLSDGTQGTFYNATLSATGGLTPYSWAVTGGTLPPGLTLDITGTITGTPTSSGTFTFTIKVTDGEIPAVSVTKQLTLKIAPPEQTTTLSITDLNWLEVATEDNRGTRVFPKQSSVAVGEDFGGEYLGDGCNSILAYGSLVRFNLSMLQGKTVDSATLAVTSVGYPQGSFYPSNFQVGVVATPWSAATVTWNSWGSFTYYNAGWSSNGPQFEIFDYPTSANIVYKIDATYIVQNWQSGSFNNNGLVFMSSTYYNACSVVDWVQETDAYSLAPQLTVTYH